MKKFGFATIAASGLAAAIIGLAGPAQADSIHHDWIYDIQPQVTVPHVDIPNLAPLHPTLVREPFHR